MDKEQVKSLLLRYDAGECTAEERALLEHWFYTQHSRQLTDAGDIIADLHEVWERIEEKPIVRPLWPRIAVAASMIFALSFIGYLSFHPGQSEKQLVKGNKGIQPGHNQAVLTLANGRHIILTKGLSGQLATQGQTSIVASGNQISYSSGAPVSVASFNSLATARGEQSPYPLILADGTRVWLNAASQITFPTAFLDKERIVKLTGEAYFEVAKDPQHPFIVSTSQQDVKVLGTHFNISSYKDDPATVTTLLEGRVEVTSKIGHRSGYLKPNQQAVLSDGEQLKISSVDTEEAVAWKNGYFMFESADIQTIMRRIARWYDIDVVYDGPVPQTRFYLVADRFSNISSLLKPLEKSNRIHFKIEGRRIMIRQ
jgi:transmembrane sensor